MNYRSIIKEHIPKKHLDFENPIVHNKPCEDSKSRIFGELSTNDFSTETKAIGTSYNPADNLPRLGKKRMQCEQDVSIIV